MKVGHYLVDPYGIYRVTAVSDKKDQKGNLCPFVSYISAFPADTNQDLLSSIPLANLSQANLRPPLSPSDVTLFFKNIAKPSHGFTYSPNSAKELVYRGEPQLLIPLLHYFWQNKHFLARAESEFMESIFSHLVEEISFVTKKRPSLVEKKLHQILNRTVSVKKAVPKN